MAKGVFYSVGVGPGDPKLMTFKAAEVIASCGVIAVPDSGAGESLALKIAGEYVRGKAIIYCGAPMTRDAQMLARHWDANARALAARLENGGNAAFLTLGDPSVYSTSIYLHERLTKMGYETVMIPGVPSFCAAAACLNAGLCVGGEPLFVLPAQAENLAEMLDIPGRKVIMKPGRGLRRIKDLLAEKGLNAAAVERASMPDQAVYNNIEDIGDGAGYFTLLVVRGP